ncbi:MAG: hypothetical protein E6H57_02685 [Betaproteobacteria bacterium]|nr:MAG: hypothetical protein E6H57_02685 [Betaproteobacteria bacterium]
MQCSLRSPSSDRAAAARRWSRRKRRSPSCSACTRAACAACGSTSIPSPGATSENRRCCCEPTSVSSPRSAGTCSSSAIPLRSPRSLRPSSAAAYRWSYQPVFQTVLALASTGRAWVKLAGADRITRSTARLADAIPFMRALAQSTPQQLVWGTDWPNIGFHARQQVHDDQVLAHRQLDAGELLDLLAEAVPDAGVRHAILVHNPERLYGF